MERSQNVENPILLFGHGGPGTSQLTVNRRNTRRLEKDFVVVNCDQLSAGKSYGANHDRAAMTVEQFVEDIRAVVDHLLAKYGQDRLTLIGHSWGSAIGVLAVARYPELFDCYVGIEQIARMLEGERESYAWTLDQAGPVETERRTRRLETMGPPPYGGDRPRPSLRGDTWPSSAARSTGPGWERSV